MNSQEQISIRSAALLWFRRLSSEDKKAAMLKSHNQTIAMHGRLPSTLTGREIEILWKESERNTTTKDA